MTERIISYSVAVSTGVLVTLITLAFQTGNKPFQNKDVFIVSGNTISVNDNSIRDSHGANCQFKEYGLPFKAISSVSEPCAYLLSNIEQPHGTKLAYNYINILLIIADVIVWSLFVRLCMILGKKLG